MIIVGPWIWDSVANGWRPPIGTTSVLDLRSIPQMSQEGGSPQGYGLFTLDVSAPNPDSDYDILGSFEDRLTVQQRLSLSSRLGVIITSFRIDNIIEELLTVRADWTGETFAKPLMPTTSRRITLHMAGFKKNRAFNYQSLQDAAALRLIREQYRINKELVAQGKLEPEFHRRILDYTQKKLGLPWQALIPTDLTSEPGPLPHKTIITESFNKADSTILGPDLTWTETSGDLEVRSNSFGVVSAGSYAEARAEHDLSSDDHYCQLMFTAGTVADDEVRVLCRFDASARTHYGCMIDPVHDYEIFKRIAGSFTFMNTSPGSGVIGDIFRCKVDGSDVTFVLNSSDVFTLTDTSITGNLRTGIAARFNGEATSFEAADIPITVVAVPSSINALSNSSGQINTGVVVTSVQYVSGTELTVDATINSFSEVSLYDVEIINPNDESDILEDGFEVTSEIKSVSGSINSVSIISGNINKGIIILLVNYISETKISTQVVVNSFSEISLYDVKLTNPDTQTTSLEDGFEVTSKQEPSQPGTSVSSDIIAIYQNLTQIYGTAISSIEYAYDHIFFALEDIVQIDDPDVKMELLRHFRDTYNSFGDRRFRNLINAAKRLNQFIIQSNEFNSINDFLEQSDVSVNQGWATISALSGYEIDPIYLR